MRQLSTLAAGWTNHAKICGIYTAVGRSPPTMHTREDPPALIGTDSPAAAEQGALSRRPADVGAADIPMEPGPGSEPIPWTAMHVAVLREAAAAFAALLDRRQSWDQLRREWRPQH